MCRPLAARWADRSIDYRLKRGGDRRGLEALCARARRAADAKLDRPRILITGRSPSWSGAPLRAATDLSGADTREVGRQPRQRARRLANADAGRARALVESVLSRVAVSPDGRHVYHGSSGGVAIFARDPVPSRASRRRDPLMHTVHRRHDPRRRRSPASR